MKKLFWLFLLVTAVLPAMAFRDLETGTFISRDPAGFVDGPNLYSYVVQNPWTDFDPEGLQSANDWRREPSQMHPLPPCGYVLGFQTTGKMDGNWARAAGSGNTAPAAKPPSATTVPAVPASTGGKPTVPNAAPSAPGTAPAAPNNVATAPGNVSKVPEPTTTALRGRQQADAEVSNITSPNAQMQGNANARGTYVDPLTNTTVAAKGKLAADHVVPQAAIKKMPGFSDLTPAQQSWILNHPLNTQGLPTALNSSKGAKLPGNWTTFRGQPLTPGYIQGDAQRGTFLQNWLNVQVQNFSGANNNQNP